MIAERLADRPLPQLSRKIVNSINNIEEKTQSDFRLEYGKNSSDQALFDDVVSYLGEYRFNLPKFAYKLKFSDGKLRDPHQGEPMRDITQRAIDKKVSEGNNYSRELAEKQGLINLDRQLALAKDNDTVVWASPPGPKNEGYGDYGFIFVGYVSTSNGAEKTINMTAIHIDHPTIEQFNKAIHLLTGEKTNHQKAEDFLANPKLVDGYLQEGYVDALLGRSFDFKPNEEEQRKFKQIIQEMYPLIADFIQSAKDPWKARALKIKELYALENYALHLKSEYDRRLSRRENMIVDFKPRPVYAEMVGKFGDKEPPKVSGSCPVNNKNKSLFSSSNLLSQGSFLNSLFGEQEWFHCPECGYQATGPIGNTCPGCDLTKDAYAKKTGIACG